MVTDRNYQNLDGCEYAISAAYTLPKHNIKKDEYTMFLKPLGNYFIGNYFNGGDFNAKYTFFGSKLAPEIGNCTKLVLKR